MRTRKRERVRGSSFVDWRVYPRLRSIILERSPSVLNRARDSRIDFDLLEDCRRAKEAAGMALSDDLRERVVEAVVEGGMSRNAAAKRFGIRHRQRRALGGALQSQG